MLAVDFEGLGVPVSEFSHRVLMALSAESLILPRDWVWLFFVSCKVTNPEQVISDWCWLPNAVKRVKENS